MVTTSIVSRIYMNTVPDVYSLVITHISRWSISSFLQVLTSTREPSWRWGLADIQYIWKTLLVKACSMHLLFTCKKSDCSHDPGNPCSLQTPDFSCMVVNNQNLVVIFNKLVAMQMVKQFVTTLPITNMNYCND